MSGSFSPHYIMAFARTIVPTMDTKDDGKVRARHLAPMPVGSESVTNRRKAEDDVAQGQQKSG